MNRLRCRVYNLASGALTDYQSAWRFQKALSERSNQLYKRGENAPDSLLLVQHPSIYTLGRGATPDNLKFRAHKDCEHKVVRIERGGEVTWHGPGQLVAYPIFNLNKHKKDLHWFTTQLEQTGIDTLHQFGIVGERSDVNTGVWVGKNKISAVGLTASRWITMHGVALNVNCDLRNFENIVPCGIAHSDRGVCSIQNLHDTLAGHLSGESFAFEDPASMTPAEKVGINEVATKWVQSFGNVFNMDLEVAGKYGAKQNTGSDIVGLDKYHNEALQELTALVQEFPSVANLEVEYYTEPASV